MGTIEARADTRAKADEGRGWYAVLARTGLVAKGISFGLVGALAQLAQHSFGKIVLIALAAGFAAYALWRFVQAYAERPDAEDGEAKVWGKRAGYVARGLIYAALTYSTVRIVTGSGAGQSQNAKAHHSAAMVLGWPGGTWLVGLAGLALVGVALWNLYSGVSRRFEDKWRLSSRSPAVRKWGSRVGMVGHVARFVVFGLIGVFLVKAALDYNPKDAIGLDGALQKLAHASYGSWLLGITAAGLIAYGLFCFVEVRLRDVSA